MKPRILAAMAVCALALTGCGHHHHTSAAHQLPPPASASQSAMGSVHPPGWGASPNGLQLPPPARGVQTVEMYDATTLATVPPRPFALAGYTAGFWKTYLPMRQKFPNAHVLSIAIQARYHADCLDVEPRDAVPAEAGPWVLADIAAGFAEPCLYSDLSEMPAVKASLAASLGSNWRARVLLWLAWYRFFPGLVQGYDAVQWTDVAHGLNLDESTVTLGFLTIAQPPYVPPRPQPLPLCFHHRMTASQCAIRKAQVASADRASAASWRAWHRVGCVRLLHRRSYAGQCSTLDQRAHFYTSRARALEDAS